jgi:uncharacterized protein YcfJ
MKISKTKSIIATTLLTILFSTAASAKGRYGRVVDVEPVYRYVSISAPREVCSAPRRYKGHRSSANTVTGAIIGGTLGHVIGKNSRNRHTATIAGVVIGSVIGHELGERHTTHNYPSNRHSTGHHKQNCVTRHAPRRKVKQLEGYDVTYRFRGKHFQTFMDQHPGKHLYVGSRRHNRSHSKQYNAYAYQQYKHSSHGAFQY